MAQLQQATTYNYKEFTDGIKSPVTKKKYNTSVIRYCKHHNISDIDSTLNSNARLVESQIMEYIESLKNNGIATATILHLISPILSFYKLSDIVVNRKRVLRFMPENKKVVKDEAYSREQIQKMLVNADHRMRMIILLLSSTGCRIGALEGLTLGNLTKIPEYNLYKIKFYESSSSEHEGLCTRECASTGIDNYLLYRQRCGEKITFNENLNRWEPLDSPLIRLQFDINDLEQVENPQPIKLEGLRMALYNYLIKCGVRQRDYDAGPRARKSIAFVNGFRKFTITAFVKSKVNYDVRQALVDHKGGYLDKNYVRLDEDFIIAEFLKAEEYLEINDEHRLKRENQTLKVKVDELAGIKQEIAQMKIEMGLAKP